MVDVTESVSKGDTMTLDQLQLGKRARVIRVHGGRGLRRNLTQMGVHPGDIVYLTQGGAFYGPVVIEVNGSKIALGRGVARKVLIDPL